MVVISNGCDGFPAAAGAGRQRTSPVASDSSVAQCTYAIASAARTTEGINTCAYTRSMMG
jgi:hypothetical protein